MWGTTAESRRVLPEEEVPLNSRGHVRVILHHRSSSGPSLLINQREQAAKRGGADATACVDRDTAATNSLKLENK
jgi:hypothetical protein